MLEIRPLTGHSDQGTSYRYKPNKYCDGDETGSASKRGLQAVMEEHLRDSAGNLIES